MGPDDVLIKIKSASINAVTYKFSFVITLCIWILSAPQPVQSQIERGELIYESSPSVLDKFYTDSLIDLVALRQNAHFLTNPDLAVYNSFIIPKRKKAFIRHVKHINENLEQEYLKGTLRSKEKDELYCELYLLEESLKHKAYYKSKQKFSFGEKIKMMNHTLKTKRVLKYKIPEESLNTMNKVHSYTGNSPYYHKPSADIPMWKQFDYLAELKKIDPKENMVVLFKDLSYSGSAPKINTYDLDLDNEWNLKWGDEVHTDVVGSRIFASLGFDVDHPYFYGKNKLTLVFEDHSEIKNVNELASKIKTNYGIDISPFISSFGVITEEMTKSTKDLKNFVGQQYARFFKCAVEARPDRVKRLGSFLPYEEINAHRKDLKGVLLAHLFIGNWDTKESNTLLTTVHDGNYNYRISAVFSDLGAGMGIKRNFLVQDFKFGLVNEFSWEVVSIKNNKIRVHDEINEILPAYKNAGYEDLYWMATQIALIDEFNLRKMVRKAHWPEPIEELYVHKLASRRASILTAFNIPDPHPIPFDKRLSIEKNGQLIVKEGILLIDYNRFENPESFISKKGRLRNYGN